MVFTSNVFMILDDEKLLSLAFKIQELLQAEVKLIDEINSTIHAILNSKVEPKSSDYEALVPQQREIKLAIINCNTNIKKRIDFIRSSDPSNYLKG